MDSSKIVILEDSKMSVKNKLSALWVAVMLCYIYGDILGFFVPGLIDEILVGNMGFLGPATQELMLSGAVLMSIPCIMVFLSLILKPKVNRWVNIVFGVVFTIIMLITMLMDSWLYYIYFGIVEVTLTLTIVWNALKWPNNADNIV